MPHDNNNNNKTAGIPVVLGGGAMRGVALLGLLDFLDEKQVICSDYTGISIGSIVAAFYTNGYSTGAIRTVFVRELMRPNIDTILTALLPPIFDPLLRLAGGFVNMISLMRHLVKKYNLITQDNLRIVAYDCLTLSPVVFEGHDYDLAIALAASCAVPGMMRPVPYEKNGRHYLFVDGGVYHPQPGSFSKKPCIIGKLIDSVVVDFLYPDRTEDFVANIGDPNCRFFSRLSARQAENVHQYGYHRAKADLRTAIERGAIPVAA